MRGALQLETVKPTPAHNPSAAPSNPPAGYPATRLWRAHEWYHLLATSCSLKLAGLAVLQLAGRAAHH